MTTEISPRVTRGVTRIVAAAKESASSIAQASTQVKNEALAAIADALEANVDDILAANAEDIETARKRETPESLIDRLTLSEERVRGIAGAVREVIGLPDPVGVIRHGQTMPNGMRDALPLPYRMALSMARPMDSDSISTIQEARLMSLSSRMELHTGT